MIVLQREYTDDCVFNETLEQHNYNTYSSAKWSTAKKTLYLGLNRHGQPRRVQAKGHNLGRLSAYARVLTQVAPLDRVETLQRRMLGAQHNVRHRHNTHRGDLIQQSLCPALPAQEKDGRDKFRCRKRKKRKKRKRRCRPGEKPGPQCQIAESSKPVPPARNQSLAANGTSPIQSKRSCEGLASEEACRREALSVPSKKRKLRVEEIAPDGEEETEGREGERGEGGGGERGGKGKGGGGRNVSGSSNEEKEEGGAATEEEFGGSGPEEVEGRGHDGGDDERIGNDDTYDHGRDHGTRHDHDHDDHDHDNDDDEDNDDDDGRGGVGRAKAEGNSRGEEDPRPLAGKAGTLRPSPWCPLNSSFLLLLVRSVWTSPRSYHAA
ncbi:hypothetical protein HZU73_08513 [Apis mellifera caucasica]|nr:hypothetical protein HZU73_08513 [Apis mellifera caucasica]KAG9428138.1 hypothetical protein HZU67_10456 [Apis mellifera carnica]